MRRAMVRALLGLILFLSGGAMASACPEPRPGGTRIDLPGAPGAQHRAQVIAGGPVALAGCAAVPGAGSFRVEPDFTIMAAGGTGPLEFRSEGDCDTVLLVAAADGSWRFDDDSAGADHARIAIPASAAGPYLVWVGTFGRGSCRARLLLEQGAG